MTPRGSPEEAVMEYRRLGRSGLKVSVLSLPVAIYCARCDGYTANILQCAVEFESFGWCFLLKVGTKCRPRPHCRLRSIIQP